MVKKHIKAVILAGGRGLDLLPLTQTRPKPMIPILGKPILEYLILQLKDAGIQDILIVTGYKGEQIQAYFQRGQNLGVTIRYADQGPNEGIESALSAAYEYVRNESEFLLLFGDIITESGLIQRTLNAFENTQADMSMTLTLRGDTGDFGVVEIGSDGLVKKVGMQKKGIEQGNYVDAGSFVLRPEIIERIRKGETLTKAINNSIKDKVKIAAAIWEKAWFDIGKPWNILEANKLLLSKVNESRIAKDVVIESNVEIRNTVIIESGTRINSGSVLNGPLYIGSNSYIGNNVLIRDHSSLGNNVLVGFGSEIKNSVVFDDAKIYRLCYVGDSIIGKGTILSTGVMTVNTTTPKHEITMNIRGKNMKTGFNKLGAIIGDECELGVNTVVFPGIKIAANSIIEPVTTIKEDVE
ncbi:MAG: bifunctional sugar-1-phosphate nucleotidylyltransferase/acetyltransferase [Candidatus Heimdallarchaeaceae archaeon]